MNDKNEKTFKELVNQIGEEYTKYGIEETYADYNLLCLIEKLSEEFFDDGIKNEVINIVVDKKAQLENKKFTIPSHKGGA